MNLAAVLAAISLASRFAAIALQIGMDAKPFIALIEKWATTPEAVTQADFDGLYAMSKPFFDRLNDTSKDVPV